MRRTGLTTFFAREYNSFIASGGTPRGLSHFIGLNPKADTDQRLLRIIKKIEENERDAFRRFVISVLGSDPYNETITLTKL